MLPHMKKVVAIALWLFVFHLPGLHAAYIINQPYKASQPDGSIIDCFVSGDEYFNWLHDEAGYTIVCAEDGYYYYAIKKQDQIVPSGWRVNCIDPAQAGLTTWIKISESEYNKRKQVRQSRKSEEIKTPHLGLLNNLVIYIKFSDDEEFATTRQTFDDKFNNASGSSLKNYYEQVSYNKFTISSTHYPYCAPTTNYSYTDTHPRSFFLPYNATSNPNGYMNNPQSTQRERDLLGNAVAWINSNSPVPTELNIDADNNGLIDNICFIIRGSNYLWGSLLWAHQDQLIGVNVAINGKVVRNYTFHPESQTGNSTLCHEMFHSLGAYDLYHYNDGGLGISPVSDWDLMGTGGGHMGAFNKWKYSGHTWVENIPLIEVSGTYSLSPLSAETGNCYRIASPYSDHEFFVVEYRRKTGLYEGLLPGSGLLVYRVDDRVAGNSSGPPDEIYIYRPGGTFTNNGNPYKANFSAETGRTTISDTTQPSSFLNDGSAGGLNIYNITSAGDSIMFSVLNSIVSPPAEFSATTQTNGKDILLEWKKNISNHNVLLACNTIPVFGTPQLHMGYTGGNVIEGGGTILYCGNDTSFLHSDMEVGRHYYYRLWSVSDTLAYSKARDANAETDCVVHVLPLSETFTDIYFPPCWSQKQQGEYSKKTWSVENSGQAGGTPCEIRSVYSFVDNGNTKLVTPALNTKGISSLKLRFRHMFDASYGTLKIRIQSITDSVNWTNEAWVINTTFLNIGPELVETTITHNLNSPSTYVAFVVEGRLYNYEYWYIDDVFIYEPSSPVYTISANAEPLQASAIQGAGNYIRGEPVTLTAMPQAGWNFLNWTENGQVLSSSTKYSFTALEPRTLTANFSNSRVFIQAISCNPSFGNVSGSGYYDQSTSVTLHANPNEGYKFINWSVNGIPVSNSNDYCFTAENSLTLEARFDVSYIRVNTEALPKNGGTVTAGNVYAYNDPVQLYANTVPGWNFSGWFENGVEISSLAEYSFSALFNRSLEARFTPQIQVYNVHVDTKPPQAGSVTGGGLIAAGNIITLVAVAQPGWAFENWEESGVVLSTESSYAFQVFSDRNITANFVKTISVNAEAIPAAGGQINGAGTYKTTEVITLQAVANPGYKFINWMENGLVFNENISFSFSDTVNRSFVAHFQKEDGISNPPYFPLLVLPNPTSGLVCFIKEGAVFNTITIFTQEGKEVLQLEFDGVKDRVCTDLSALPNGIYYIRVLPDNGNPLINKVILKR